MAQERHASTTNHPHFPPIMGASEPRTAVYEFGDYRLEPELGLLRGGEVIHVPPKELALLGLLLRAQGAIVSATQIEAEVWPRQIVSDSSITRCIYSLRKIFGNERGDYIITVPKRGYRFAKPAVQLPFSPTSIAAVPESDAQRTARAYHLEGVREASRSQADALANAVHLFEQAHRLDPMFLDPLVAIANCRVAQLHLGLLSPRDASRLVHKACDLALASEPELAPALVVKGFLLGAVDRNSHGLELVEHGLEIDPGHDHGYVYYAVLLRAAGRHSEAVSAARKADELNPFLLPQPVQWTLFCAGLIDQALESARKAHRVRPYMDVTNSFLSAIASWVGHHDEALRAGRLARQISNRNPTLSCPLAYALARAGDHDAARELANEIASSTRPRVALPHLAPIYVELGERERAITCLREARAEGCPYFPTSRYDPRLADLMKDAQVRALYD